MEDISVRFHNGNMNLWLKLPTTLEALQNALTAMGTTDGNYSIDRCRADVGGRLDAVITGGDLAAVNYFAARVKEFTPEQMKKLDAILESPLRSIVLESIERAVDFTYNIDSYELIYDVRSAKSLAQHFIFDSGEVQMPREWAEGINLQEFGINLEQHIPGYYTYYGYLIATGAEWLSVYEKTGEIPPEYQILPEGSVVSVGASVEVDSYPKVYPYTEDYARLNGELDLYQDSFALNFSCSLAIEDAVRKAPDFDSPRYGRSVLTDVLREYGSERVLAVLAHTVRQKSRSAFYSRENRDWAKNYPAPPASERANFTVGAHPATVDRVINFAREAARELENVREDSANQVPMTSINTVSVSDPAVVNTADLFDPSVTQTDMYAYGYSYEGMIPLGKERALELFDKGCQIFKLQPIDSERVAISREDVEAFSGMFGVLNTEKSKQARSASIEVFILNRELYENGKSVGDWLTLPTDVGTLRGLLDCIGVSRPSEAAYSVTAIRLPFDCLSDYVTKHDSLDELNMLASYMDNVEDYELDKLQAILTSGVKYIGEGAAALINVLDADNLDAFNLIDAADTKALGRYWDEERPDDISFEEYGRQIAEDEKGVFTEWGYIHFRYKEFSIEYNGIVPEEYRIVGEALRGLLRQIPERGGVGDKPSVLDQIRTAREVPRVQNDNAAQQNKKSKGDQEI